MALLFTHTLQNILSIIYIHIYSLCNSLHLLMPNSQPTPTPNPLGKHESLSVSVSVSVSEISSSVSDFGLSM